MIEDFIAYWPMNELSGSNVADFSGNSHTGTAIGTTVVPGKINNGRSMNGSGDYVDVGDLGLTSGTMTMWIRPTTVTGDLRLYTQLTGLTTQEGTTAINQVSGESGSVWVYTSPTWERLCANSTLTANNWHHLVFVCTGGNVTLYINSVQQSTGVANFDFSGVSMGLGALFTGVFGGTFNGIMDEVRAYNRALTVVEINQVYLYGITKFIKPIRPNPFAPGLAR